MVAFSFPSFMYWKASGVASKPMVTLFLMPAADIASTAPMIISSLAPKTASNWGYFWIRLSITFWPSERPKLAVWLTSSFTFDFLITSSKPALRSLAAEAPGVPSSSITLPLLPSLSMMNFAAARPPWTLSAPTWTSTVSVFDLRSTVATGMPAFTAASMAGTSESTVMGEIRMACTPWATKFSTSAACLDESFWASANTIVAPSLAADRVRRRPERFVQAGRKHDRGAELGGRLLRVVLHDDEERELEPGDRHPDLDRAICRAGGLRQDHGGENCEQSFLQHCCLP